MRRALLANLDAVWADEVLRERGGSVSSREVYYLTWLASGDKKKADLARAKRALEEMHRGITPEA